MKYRMSYPLMQIKILSHVNPNVSSKILRLVLFLFIHILFECMIIKKIFQKFGKIFFSKFLKIVKSLLTHYSNIFIKDADIRAHFRAYLCSITKYFPRFRE